MFLWLRLEPVSLSFLNGEGTMRQLRKFVVEFLKREDGPTAVEYAVMLALIIVVCIAAITQLGKNANATFDDVALNTSLSASS